MIPRLPPPSLFPYTTLFRSEGVPIYFERGSDVQPVASADNLVCPSRSADTYAAPQRPTIDATAVATMVGDRKSTRLNSSHLGISYAVFCLKIKMRGLALDAL